MKCISEQELKKSGAANRGAFSEMDSLFALLGMFDPSRDASEPESGEPGDWVDELILTEVLSD